MKKRMLLAVFAIVVLVCFGVIACQLKQKYICTVFDTSNYWQAVSTWSGEAEDEDDAKQKCLDANDYWWVACGDCHED